MKKISFVIALFLVAACSSKVIKPTQSSVDRISGSFSGVTLADLEEGRNLLKTKCGTCHDLPKPELGPEKYWRGIVPPMAEKAKLNEDQTSKVLQYCISVSKAE